MVVELTLKNGTKVKFEKFGEINFGQGIKSVDDLTAKEKTQLQNMYRHLAAQTQRELVRLKMKGDKTTVTDELRKLQLNDLKNSLDRNLWEITQTNQIAIQNDMLQTSQAVIQDMTKWLNSVGIDVKTSFAHVPRDVVSNIVSGRLYGKDWNFSSRIWGDYNKSVSDITKIVAQGIAENKPTYDIAKDLERYVNPNAVKPWDWSKVYPGSKKQIDYNAQRLARTMINHAYQQSIVETCKSNPFVKGIQWRSAFSKTTCQICESLNGNIFPVDEIPLDHPNGKCSFIAVISKSSQEIEDDLLKWVDGEADEEFNQKMELFAEKAGFTKADIDLRKLKYKPKETTKEFKQLQKQIADNPAYKQIKYNEVQMLNEKLSTEQIINKLAGADKTTGSCASLSLAYIGNKYGFDVTDFRGGESTDLFACNIKRIIKDIDTFKYIKSTNSNELKAANELFRQMEQDKEYILITGGHAAIVRKIYKQDKDIFLYQYLELQSGKRENKFYNFGFHKGDGSDSQKEIGVFELLQRFGAQEQREGNFSYLVSINENKIKENDDFKTLLGYLNTNTKKQVKGVGGGEK